MDLRLNSGTEKNRILTIIQTTPSKTPNRVKRHYIIIRITYLPFNFDSS